MTHTPIPPEVEEGWVHDHEGIFFMEKNGPIWYKPEGDKLTVGFKVVAERHGNSQEIIHGGMIAAFADFALGHKVWYAHDKRKVVTVQLDVNFIAAGKDGDWIYCTPEIIRQTRSITFIRGDIKVGDRIIATAQGVWKVVGG